jgi:hypothetical protein
MANRVGTYLSDANVDATCVASAKTVPMDKVFSLVQGEGITGQMPQRPKNVGIMLRALAKVEGKSVNNLREMYILGLESASPAVPMVIPPQAVTTARAAKTTAQSTGAIIAQQVAQIQQMLQNAYSQGTYVAPTTPQTPQPQAPPSAPPSSSGSFQTAQTLTPPQAPYRAGQPPPRSSSRQTTRHNYNQANSSGF